MASGHVNRAKRPNTWQHRPKPAYVKKVLANPEPSTHDPLRKWSVLKGARRKASYRSVALFGCPTRNVERSSSILGSDIECAEIAKCCTFSSSRRSVDVAKNRPSIGVPLRL
jgi:hypothetical protein